MDTLTTETPQQACLMLVLRQLLEHADLSANALAKRINLPTPTVNRLLTGEVQDPRASTLITIANYFGITIDQLLGNAPLTNEFITNAGLETLVTKPPMSIPILSMTDASHFEDYLKKPTDWFRWQPQHQPSESAEKDKIFSVMIKNNLYEPIFPHGALIIVNPTMAPHSGDYVLAGFTDDSIAVIKKYIAEGQYKYLYPLQQELKTIDFDRENSRIIGVIIVSYISFKE